MGGTPEKTFFPPSRSEEKTGKQLRQMVVERTDISEIDISCR